MEAKLKIENVSVDVIVGVRDHERSRTQRLLINIEIWEDICLQKDVLAGFIDYSSLVKAVTNSIQSRHHKTIESVALNVAKLVSDMTNITKYIVRVQKNIAYSVTFEISSGVRDGLLV